MPTPKKKTTRKTTRKTTKKTSKKVAKKTTKKRSKSSTSKSNASTRKSASASTRSKPESSDSSSSEATSSIENDAIRRIVDYIVVDCLDEAEIRVKLGDNDEAEELIQAAKARLGEVMTVDLDAELGASVARLKYIYAKAKKQDNLTAMIQSQKELSKLINDHRSNDAPDGPKGDSPDNSKDSEELRLIGEHLYPLNLADRDKYPLSGHARIAADRLRALEARQ